MPATTANVEATSPPANFEELLSRLHFADSSRIADVFNLVARLTEDERTRQLRPHEEHGSPAGEGVTSALRTALDDALDALTAYEIALQCNILTCRDGETGLPDDISASLEELVGSEAFLRYVDSYLFFGVRFLAGRSKVLREAWRQSRSNHPGASDTGNALTADLTFRFNQPIFYLSKPPAIEQKKCAWSVLLEQNEKLPEDEQEALNFLDGYLKKESSQTADGGAPSTSAPHPNASVIGTQELEKWLETPESLREPQASLQTVADGLRSWANRRREIYIPLGRVRRNDDAVGESMVTGSICDTARAGRLALADFYYVAQILRATVSPRGEVAYAPKSWLQLLRVHADQKQREALLRAEEVLRAALTSACELIQNAAEITAADNRAVTEPETEVSQGESWRYVFDTELKQIKRQRLIRDYRPPNAGPDDPVKAGDGQQLPALRSLHVPLHLHRHHRQQGPYLPTRRGHTGATAIRITVQSRPTSSASHSPVAASAAPPSIWAFCRASRRRTFSARQTTCPPSPAAASSAPGSSAM